MSMTFRHGFVSNLSSGKGQNYNLIEVSLSCHYFKTPMGTIDMLLRQHNSCLGSIVVTNFLSYFNLLSVPWSLEIILKTL